MSTDGDARRTGPRAVRRPDRGGGDGTWSSAGATSCDKSNVSCWCLRWARFFFLSLRRLSLGTGGLRGSAAAAAYQSSAVAAMSALVFSMA